MNFCKHCHNLYEITNNLDDLTEAKKEQKGGKKKNKEDSEEQEDEPQSEEEISDEEIDTLIQKIMEKKEVELPKKLNPNMIKKSIVFRKLSTKDKEYIINSIQELLPKNKKKLFANIKVSENVAYYICKKCAFHEVLKPKTLIYSETTDDFTEYFLKQDHSELIHDATLPHTKNYECMNKKCITHTQTEMKDAVFKRINNNWYDDQKNNIPVTKNSYRILTICCACKTSWIN
jgi:hypothetical protein